DRLTFPQLLHFWKRRWFRTLPNYFLVLLVSLFVYRNTLSGIPVHHYFFFLQNFTSEIPRFFVESWSLSIEEWFYLLLPFPFLLLHKTKNKRGLLLFLLIAIITGISLLRYQFTKDMD